MKVAPTRLNRTLEQQGINIAKYHEAVNIAIAYAISRLLCAHTEVVHADNRGWCFVQDTK